jgi:hypothetical protein
MAKIIEEIRELRYAKPFVPFKIRTVDGDEFLVPSFDYVGTPPGGTRVVIPNVDGTFTFLTESKIASVEKAGASAG